MRRPFVWPGVSLTVGVLLGRIFPLLNTPLFLFLCSLLPFLWVFRGKRLFLPLFLLGLLGIGALRIRQLDRLPLRDISHFAQGDWVSLEGRVDSLPELKEKGRRRIYSFVLDAKNFVRQREFFETEGKVQVFLFNPQEAASYGGHVRLRGRLSLPKRALNPGEFDYRKYLFDQGIHAVFEGYGSRSLQILEMKNEMSSWPLALLQRLRDAGSRRFDSLFPPPVNALLQALVLGIRKSLPEGIRDDFMKTGTTHLIAISGMNITLVAGSLYLLALCIGLPQKAAAWVGLFSTAGYVFLSGSGIPVVRAGWMAGLFFTGVLLEREKDLLNSLFFALFAILIADPRALFQVGLQLSFLCVFSLITLTPDGLSRRWGDGLQTLVVLVGTFPLCLVYFSVFSWMSFLTNILAIPLFNLGVLGGMGSLLASGIPFGNRFLIGITSLSLKAGLAWIRFWAKQSWSYSYLRSPSWKLLLFYYGSLALVWVTYQTKQLRSAWLRAFSLSLWFLAFVLFFLPAGSENFVLTVLAVGQNEVLHVKFPGENHWLVNAGRGTPSDQARWTLAPLLRRKGVRRLGGIVLTDFSRRHAGGLPTLLDNFSVDTLLFPKEGKTQAVPLHGPRGLKKMPLLSGDQVPVEDQAGFRVVDVIQGEAVLLIYYGEQKFLLLPSWKPGVSERLLPRLKEFSPVEVLVWPARGELSAGPEGEILSLLSPRWVVFPKWNSTLEPLLESLRQKEIPWFFLSETGALRFEIQKGKWQVSSFTSRPYN